MRRIQGLIDDHGTGMTTGILVATLYIIPGFLSPPTLADSIDGVSSVPTVSEADSAGRIIDVRTDDVTDNNIRERLGGIYGELESLDGVTVSVTNSVVSLSGTVASSQADQRAVEIAGQIEGVIEVVDELTIDTDVGRRVESTLDRLQAAFNSLLATLPVLLLALLIIAAFWFLGRWIVTRRAVFRAIAPNTFIADLLALVARIVIVLAGLILALTLLDATSIIGSVLGAAGIVGLALGFAVRDTVENFIASILLSLRTPFIARDYVRIGEHEGTVARLTSRATLLISPDGNLLRVPNSLVYKAVIVNYTRQPERRFEFVVGVDTDLDLNAAQRTALDTIYGVSGVLTDPAATVLVTELGDSNVSLTVRAWIDQRNSDLMKVRSEAIRQVKQAFDDAGIAMPEPIYRLRFQEGLLNIRSGDTDASTGEQTGLVSMTRRTADSASRAAGRATVDLQEAGGAADVGNNSGSSRAAIVTTETFDTSVDDSVERRIERELSEPDTENLLPGDSRTE